MRTTYILIDYENVQPDRLHQLAHDHFKIYVFVGLSQTKLSFETADSLQRLGTRAEYIKISGNGTNALDFHIAYYIGRLAASDPKAFFHIVSKDSGFDPLIKHLKSNGISVNRVRSISEILLRDDASLPQTPAERLESATRGLKRMKGARPSRIKTLRNVIDGLFRKQLTEPEVTGLIQALQEQGLLSIMDSRITYDLPEDEPEPTPDP